MSVVVVVVIVVVVVVVMVAVIVVVVVHIIPCASAFLGRSIKEGRRIAKGDVG